MSKKLIALFALVLLAAFLGSCAHTLPVGATSNNVGSKVGVASTTMILGIFAPDGGNAGVQKAAENGGIKKISTVDQKIEMVFLTIIMKRSTIVTGE